MAGSRIHTRTHNPPRTRYSAMTPKVQSIKTPLQSYNAVITGGGKVFNILAPYDGVIGSTVIRATGLPSFPQIILSAEGQKGSVASRQEIIPTDGHCTIDLAVQSGDIVSASLVVPEDTVLSDVYFSCVLESN